MLKKIYSHFHRHYHRKYHGVYRHAPTLFAIDLGLLAFALFLFGFGMWFFLWTPINKEIEIRISLGNGRLRSGDEATIAIDYFNHSKSTLEDGQLNIALPPGFDSGSSSSVPVGELKPGTGGHAEIKGRLWVTPGQEERIVANLKFHSSGQQPNELSYGVFILKLPDSALSLDLVMNTSSFAGQPLPFTISTTNQSNEFIKDVGIGLTNLNSPTTTFWSLQPGETKTITGTAMVPAVSNFRFFAAPAVRINGNLIPQKITAKSVTVYSPQVSVRTAIDSTSSYAEPGMDLPVQISWHAQDNYEYQNPTLHIAPNSGIVDLDATADANHWQKIGDELVADEKTSGLREGTTKLILKLLPTFGNKADVVDSLVLKTVFNAGLAAVPEQTFSASSNKISLPLSSEVALNSEVRYYSEDGDQLGRGPLPPQVGKTTKYWVLVNVNNTTNPLRSPKLQLDLAEGVQFTGRQSVTLGPELTNPVGNTVVWNYDGQIPTYSQNGFYFEVAVHPTMNNVGATLLLVKKIEFSATDDRVGKIFNLENSSLSNTLPASDPGADRGAIVIQ